MQGGPTIAIPPPRPVCIEVPLPKSPRKPEVALRLESEVLNPALVNYELASRQRHAERAHEEALHDRQQKAHKESAHAADVARLQKSASAECIQQEANIHQQRSLEAAARAERATERRASIGKEEAEKARRKSEEHRKSEQEEATHTLKDLARQIDEGRERHERAELERVARAQSEIRKVEEGLFCGGVRDLIAGRPLASFLKIRTPRFYHPVQSGIEFFFSLTAPTIHVSPSAHQSEIEETLNRIKDHPDVDGIIITHNEKAHRRIIARDPLSPIQAQADLYAEQCTALAAQARSAVRDLDPSNDLSFLRIRTTHRVEIMIAPEKEYTLICSQHIPERR
ncbi:putative dynein light chain roadblock-type [Paratrimastix pyriformis]|uniref:Dynein light chain roadblock-type n=1 Tax=Paratrimastix pyriformis TaxID=342808 RepID=A0ABQ8UPR4_9EUKA|nr:putative dynein light chain roadblock-type [Paratrimastix pyriformis]